MGSLRERCGSNTRVARFRSETDTLGPAGGEGHSPERAKPVRPSERREAKLTSFVK